jgi:hypothetical protein
MVLENIKREADAWKSHFRNVKNVDFGRNCNSACNNNVGRL